LLLAAEVHGIKRGTAVYLWKVNRELCENKQLWLIL
jgi:hypothetical protein